MDKLISKGRLSVRLFVFHVVLVYFGGDPSCFIMN